MAVAYLIRFHIVPEKRARFLELIGGVLDSMRAEPMFHLATLHRHPDNDNRMMLYEVWEDHEDVLTVQLLRPYREVWHRELDELLVEPRDVSIWSPVRADPA